MPLHPQVPIKMANPQHFVKESKQLLDGQVELLMDGRVEANPSNQLSIEVRCKREYRGATVGKI